MQQPLQQEVSSACRARALWLLLADDNAINRRVARLPMAETIEAENDWEAIERLEERRFNVAPMNIHVPEMGGVAVMYMIRASDAPWVAVRIIAVTANALSGDRERFVAAVINGYVARPVDRTKLISAIEDVLRKVPESISREDGV